MKTTILALLISISGYSQVLDTLSIKNLGQMEDTSVVIYDENNYINFDSIYKEYEIQQRKVQKLNLANILLEYERECVGDTIKAIPFDEQFIISHNFYREMVTTEQLNKRGYVFSYRWVVNTNPFEFEYYFIKELTLKGFILWLKKE